ncbi:MFS transporter [Desertivirga arenae]|uniref:MFS transporter n=1 Tax=Desertivirga arenae TaxID=2810309 RepID=UPI001A974802|nr:MFS transporter [Pedobacter sp. SYSU D00823]
MLSEKSSIYTLQFALLCLSSLLFSASFNMLIPELPAYLSSLGGAEHKGLIIALFTITAGISRPFSGKLTDTIGRVPVMAVGSIVCFVCGFLYPVLSSVAGFLFLRLLHGFSTGFKPTATAAYVADLVPVDRRGEALGIHGLCFSTGMALGPAIGSAITLYYSINILFYCSSAFALLSILIIMNMKETVNEKQAFKFGLLKMQRNELVEWKVFPAAFVTFLSYMSYGAMLTVVPDWSEHLGIANKGLFFMTFTISSVLIRFVSGKASDKYGRVRVLKIASVVLIASLVMIGKAESMSALLIASTIYGIATGILSPAYNAWTIDLSHPERRGMAVATMYIALEAGIGLGAFLAGWFYQDLPGRIPMVFYASAGFVVLSLIYLLFYKKEAEL